MHSPPSESSVGLRARLLGPVQLEVDGDPLPDSAWPRRTSRMVLLLLLATPGHRLTRDAVLEALWPDATVEAATRSLYVAIHGLRRVLEPEVTSGRASRFVDVAGDLIRLRPDAGIEADIDQFEAALDATTGDRREHLASALSLYAGDLLAEEPYLDWPVARREHLRWRWREAVLEYAALERDAGRPLLAVAPIERVIQADPTDEAAYRALMRAYAEAGRREDALRQYERCMAVLDEELGTDPSEETRALARAIEDAPTPVSEPAVSLGRIDALPAPPNALVGRGRDVEELIDLLCQPQTRLVTITGPGGIGKTRLSLEAASLVRDEFTGGACFVPLAQIHDPALVLPAVARAIGLEDSAVPSALVVIRDRLEDREVLLVLDNLEQVVAAVDDLAQLLEACPGLTLLATSREPLRLRAEHEFPLAPLPVPAAARSISATAIGRYAAVDLFVQRARAVRRSFTVTEENAAAIGYLCARLDGFPLAIELAAARIRHLEPQDLVAGLEDRFTLLAGGFRDLPPRQRTMRATIAWSCDLLSPEEQRTFAHLAVFTGDADAEAVVWVAGRSATEHLPDLADRGLLTVESITGQTRYGMYETIREFAREMLAARGETEAATASFATWALDLVDRASPKLTGPEQNAWFDRLELELPNLRTAFEYLLVDPARTEDALRLAAGPWRFFWNRGITREGLDWQERALALSPGSDTPARADAHFAAGELAFSLGQYPVSATHFEAAIAIRLKRGDEAGAAEARNSLGLVARQQGELDRAATLHQEALDHLESTDRRRTVASCLNNLGAVAYYRGDTAACEDYWTRALAVIRELQDQRSEIMLLGNLGALALMRRDIERAIAYHEDGLALARRNSDYQGITQAISNLAGALFEHGDLDRAAQLFAEGLERCQEVGDLPTEAVIRFNMGQLAERQAEPDRAAMHYAASTRIFHDAGNQVAVAACLERIGPLLASRNDLDLAVHCLAAAQAIRDTTGAARDPVDHGGYAEEVAAIRERIGKPAFDQRWNEGLQLPVAEVVASSLIALVPATPRPERTV